MEWSGILDVSKTYGTEKNKKLYMCRPNSPDKLACLIPYSKPVEFDKSVHYIYILFQYKTDTTGILTAVIGRVESLDSTYEYLLYCKSLNHSIQSFTKKATLACKQYTSIVDEIANKNNLPTRTGHIFTVDSSHTIDYDDAISIHKNVVSIYISNVPILLDYFGLSQALSKRVSSVYLPDKKRSMLPTCLNEWCSLRERTNRICLVLDITYENGKPNHYNLSLCKALISRNYSYDSDKMNHPDILSMYKLCGIDNIHDLIAKFMVEFNQYSSQRLKEMKKGIYKHVISYKSDLSLFEKIECFKRRAMPYESYPTNASYGTFTSPIRRLVDIYNMFDLCKGLGLYVFSQEPQRITLDTLNRDTASIRHVQYKCKLLALFERGETYDGYIYDTMDPKVYFPDLNIIYPFSSTTTYPEYSKYTFRLVMLNDEVSLKRKLRIVIHT